MNGDLLTAVIKVVVKFNCNRFMLQNSVGHVDESLQKPDNSSSSCVGHVMRDFVGLDLKDRAAVQSMMKFSIFSTEGNMDEAFKAIKQIKRCVCVCVRTRVSVCGCGCVYVCVCMSVCVCVCVWYGLVCACLSACMLSLMHTWEREKDNAQDSGTTECQTTPCLLKDPYHIHVHYRKTLDHQGS